MNRTNGKPELEICEKKAHHSVIFTARIKMPLFISAQSLKATLLDQGILPPKTLIKHKPLNHTITSELGTE